MTEDKNQNTEDPGDLPILSEQEWAEFERSFTKESTRTATFKEPSARQRELSEKWKRQRPLDGGWRADGTPTDLADHPEPPRTRSAPVDYGTGRRRRWRRNVAWVVLAALITSAIIGVPRLFSSAKSGNDRNPNMGPASGTPDGSGPGTSTSASAAGSDRDPLRFSVAGLDYQLVMLAPQGGRGV